MNLINPFTESIDLIAKRLKKSIHALAVLYADCPPPLLKNPVGEVFKFDFKPGF